jgi:hypothetical protein
MKALKSFYTIHGNVELNKRISLKASFFRLHKTFNKIK